MYLLKNLAHMLRQLTTERLKSEMSLQINVKTFSVKIRANPVVWEKMKNKMKNKYEI